MTRSNDVYAFTELYNVNDRTYTANPLNQYTNIANAAGARTLAYDGNGNLTQIKITGTGEANGWGYDPENRLTSETTTAAGSTTATPSAALAYDPLGRLYAITDQTPATDVTTRFAYDGGQIIAEYDTNVQLARRYVHVPGSADEPIVWYEGAGLADKRFLHADERGSIVAVSNSIGGIMNVNSYDEYGFPDTDNIGRFQYTGQAWLPEVRLYYYKARMYLPTLGRFMQTDPIGYDDGMNMYNYVGGDPVNYTDPLGLNKDIVVTGRPHADGPGGGGGAAAGSHGTPGGGVGGGGERGSRSPRVSREEAEKDKAACEADPNCTDIHVIASAKGDSSPIFVAIDAGLNLLDKLDPFSLIINSITGYPAAEGTLPPVLPPKPPEGKPGTLDRKHMDRDLYYAEERARELQDRAGAPAKGRFGAAKAILRELFKFFSDF